MAKPKKRQFGTRFCWLGFNFFTNLGLVAAQPAKVAKAVATIDSLLDPQEDVTFGAYRSFIGLCEHLMVVVGHDRSFMFHMYGQNFARGYKIGPAALVRVNDLMRQQLLKWRSILTSQAGIGVHETLSSSTIVRPSSVTAEVRLRESGLLQPKPVFDEEFFMFSDAAAEALIRRVA